MARDEPARHGVVTVTVAALTLLALALRLYRLDELSFWWDEYTSLAFLEAPTLLQFLRQNTTFDPATLPAYYTLEYLWYHHVSAAPDNLRYLSVLLSLPGIPLAYLLGRETFGRTAGLVAALCLALSPIHLFHAQSIRMYVLFTTLALASAVTFVRLMQDARWPWWAAHAVCNLLLFWTHPFAPLLVAAQGITLLIQRVPVRRWLTWGVVNSALYLPTAAYILQVTFWSPQSTGAWLQLPSLASFLGDLLFDDVVAATYQLRVPTEFWAANAPWMLTVRPVMDGLFIGAVLLAIVVVLVRLRRKAPAACIFFLVWLLLPATVLYVLSLVWRPCIFPRYTLYSSLAVYCFLGAAARALRHTGLQWCAGLLVAVLLGYQTALALPGPQRTDWKGAAALVREESDTPSLVALTASIDRDTFAYNFSYGQPGPRTRPMAAAERDEDVAELLARYLALGNAQAWAVIAGDWFAPEPPAAFEAEAQAYGLLYERSHLPGIRPLYVYAVRQAATAGSLPAPPADAPLERVIALGDLAIELMLHGDPDDARVALDAVLATHLGRQMAYGRLVEALDGAVPVKNACAAVRASIRAGGHLSEGRHAKAIEACREAVEKDPGLLVGWYNLLMALLESGRFDEALPVLEQMLARDFPDRAVFRMTFGHLMDVIGAGGNAQAAYTATQALRQAEELHLQGDTDAAAEQLRRALDYDPTYGLAHLFLARLHVARGNTALAQRELERAAEISPGRLGPLVQVIEAHYIEDDPSHARELAAALPEEERVLLHSLIQDDEDSPE